MGDRVLQVSTETLIVMCSSVGDSGVLEGRTGTFIDGRCRVEVLLERVEMFCRIVNIF